MTIQGPADLTFTQLASGDNHALAIGADGNTYAWGEGSVGALGQGSFVSANSPVRVQLPENERFMRVSAGRYHSAGLTDDGTLYAWGRNDAQQAGGDSWVNSNIPVAINTQLKFAQISAGGDHTLALTADGAVYEWGDMSFLAPGAGTVYQSRTPIQVEGASLPAFAQVSAGMYHSAGLSVDGSLYVWGWSDATMEGGGPRRDDQPVKIAIPGSESLKFVQISAGDRFTVALAEGGEAYAWGTNWRGQLGTGGQDWSGTPVKISLPGDEQIVSVTAGEMHASALTATGAVYGWGNNWGGQAGAGTEDFETTPLRVEALQGENIAYLDAGATSASALTQEGVVYAWGANSYGQLGNGAFSSVPNRVPLPILTGVVSEVTFGGTPGTDLGYNGDGTWSATTPARASTGPVDVGVSWTSGGEPRPDITLTAGFTYTGAAPTVTDPGDQSVSAGEDAVFTVTATGTPAPAVTWHVDAGTGSGWAELVTGPGITISDGGYTLKVTAEPTHNGYRYRAIATNSVDAATSNPATLTVNVAPEFTAHPRDVVTTAGDTARFTAAATGHPAPTLSWEVFPDGATDWVDVTPDDGAVSAGGTIFEVGAAEAHSGFQYRAVATNLMGTMASDPATLTVSPAPVAPVFTLDPIDQTVTAGDTATFTTGATGIPSPAIRWEMSANGGVRWTSITADSGAVSADGESLEIETTQAHSGYQYRAIATSSAGTSTSDTATLTVNAAPVIPPGTKPEKTPAVPADKPASGLAATGSTPTPAIGIAALSLVLGVGFVLRARRKKV